MADNNSDGSDVEVDNDDEIGTNNGNFFEENDSEVPEDPIDRAMQQDFTVFAMFNEDDVDESYEFEGFDDVWRFENFQNPNAPKFRQRAGPQIQHPQEYRAIDYFELFYSEEMWDRLVTETNRYSDQQRTVNPPPANAPKFKHVDRDKMKAFIGLTLSMGIMRLPQRHDYWRKNKWLFETNFNSVMSRDNFDLIWRYFHLQDNTIAPAERDPLWKMRWYLDYLVSKFKTVYFPNEHVAIDESMVKFKGRLAFRQYLPSKPIKWGVKVWSLCESSTGYAWNFQIYTGKEEGRQEHGLTYRVVMDLTRELQGSHMKVFMDNFYSSVQLFQTLRACGLLACGTVRANRKGLPVELLPRNVALERGAYKVAQKDEMMYSIWQDTKPVLVISNYHDPSEEGTVQRRQGRQNRVAVKVPLALQDYQMNMRGVDLCDQMIGYYMINHRSKKWWRRIYFYVQMVAVHNAYIVAKKSNPDVAKNRWPTFQDFVDDLATELIAEVRAARAPPLVEAPLRAAAVHDIVIMYNKKRHAASVRCELVSTNVVA
jgi:hypothetical protein